MNHAPYALLGDLVLAYGKTTKTACGLRRPTAKLVDRDETDCPRCISAIASDRREAAAMTAIAHDMLASDGCPHCGRKFDSVTEWAKHNRDEHY